VRFADLAWAAATMWRPLLGIVAIMVMTGVARRVGVLDGLADMVFARARGSSSRLFTLVFAFGAVTAASLNNDSAVLLLTPLVVDAARKRAPSLVVPLAFAVFLSAGIAPVVVSNPMNMVVASAVGIGFNEYAARMAIPALAGCLVTFGVIRALFHRDLRAAPLVLSSEHARTLAPEQRRVLVALAAIILAYPVVSYFGGPVWAVAACGALLLLFLAARAGHAPTSLVRTEVHLDVLLFLVAVLVLSLGLRNVGVVERLSAAYAGASPAKIGVISALGSAVLNNHPMANLNMLALGGSHTAVLAALVGGDLGPRLFPMGSLAGLLWLEMLRRAGVDVGVRKFLLVGALATLPTLAVALAVL
jgi:arsenical pump membrane protein